MKLRIHFESDWRIGSGAGIPGSLDDLVQRDQEGLPYVPAKTVKGMVRDGCELVAEALGGSWPEVVDALLGTDTHSKSDPGEANHPSRLVIRSARLPKAVRAALRGPGKHALREALTFVVPHVSIDPATGAAKEEHLFHVEVVRAGAELESVVEANAPLTEAQLALLHAGAAAVRRIGGKRRRGLGRCSVELVGAAAPPDGAGDWLSWLESNLHRENLLASIEAAPLRIPPGSPFRPGSDDGGEDASTASSSPAPRAAGTGAGTVWAVLPFAIEAMTPLCLPQRTVGNLVETMDHVPGTLLLPWLHRALEGWGADADSLIREGGALVTPAYPVQADGSPSWPVPQALHREKGSAGLEGSTARVLNLLEPGPDEALQLKPYRGGYVQASTDRGERPSYLSPRVGVAMHNTVDDRRQRPTEEVGGVFTFELLPAGTRLAGEVRVQLGRCPPELVPDDLRRALEEQGEGYAVGRAKHDEYGQIRIDVDRPRVVREEPERDEQPKRDRDETPGTLTVWLLSDVLLRDEWLGWSATPDDLRCRLQDALGVGLRPADLPWAFARGRRTEGWVRSWNLPRPSLTGLAAGSCFRFSVESTPHDLAERIERLHLEGIGERRAEGYGQVRIGAPLLESREIPQGTTPEEPVEDPAHEAEEDTPFLRLIETEAWKEAIREAALRVVEEDAPLGMAPDGGPPNSQVGALRTAFLPLGGGGTSREDVLAWLVHLRATQNRADKWPSGTLAGLMRLLDWEPGDSRDWPVLDEKLRAQDPEKRTEGLEALEHPEGFDLRRASVWTTLFPSEGPEPAWPPTASPGAVPRLAEELWSYALRTLINTACADLFHRREAAPTEEETHGAAAS